MCVVIDLDVVCLICLQPSKDMQPIFSTDGDDNELQIAQKISILSELKIDQNNKTLPRKMCMKCLQDLKSAWRFRKNCQAAVTIFQTIVKLDDAQQPEHTDTKELAEQDIIKVPAGLQIKRINIDNEDVLKKQTVVQKFIIQNDKSGSTLYEELESHNDVENQDNEETHEFQTIEEVDENDEQNAEIECDAANNLVEYYLTEDETISESTTKIEKESPKTYVEKKPASLKKQQYIDIEERPVSSSYIEKPLARGRPKKQNLLQKDTLGTNVVRTKTKGCVILNDTNMSKTEVRQVKTRKRKSVSPELKTPKICELCGNSYRFQHALNAHMRRHFNDKPFPCECCDKAFVSNVELRRHMRVHTGQKPYACQYCERRFSDFGSRIKHERTHTGERPYHCITCGKSFAYPHVLTTHVLSHTGEKRFRCNFCSKGFTKKTYLTSHISQHHSNVDNFRIVVANTTANSQNDLKSETYEECTYTTEFVNEDAIDEAEEYDEEEDSNQEPTKIIITHSLRKPKMEEIEEPDEFRMRTQ